MSIARPYATAAFSVADESNKIEQWSTALSALSVAVSDNAMQSLLKDPSVSSDQIADFLRDILRAVLSGENAAIDNFLNLIAENKRFSALPEIVTLFQAEVAKREGYTQLTVTSAYPLSVDQKAAVKTRMEKQLSSDVKINYQEDSDLIGGLVVRSKDWVLDDSVRGKLDRLAQALS